MSRYAAFFVCVAMVGLGACATTDDNTPLPPPPDTGPRDTAVDTGEPDTNIDLDTGVPPTEGGPCTPGDIETKKCGKCGKQLRTCGSSGWLDWKPCADELVDAECSVGETRVTDCDMCGKQTDTCDTTTCTWVVGTCTGSGPCAEGDIEKTAAGCSTPGEVRVRTCTAKCAWSDWSACGLPTGWVKISTPPTAIGGRAYPSAIYDGKVSIFWGGYYYASPYNYSKNDGAYYNIVGDVWTALPTAPTALSAGRYQHSAVFDGTNMIIWGGISSSSTVNNTGALYDTVAKAWSTTAMATTGAPTARAGAGAVWATTTKEMILWGGCTSVGSYGASCSVAASDGFHYDPVKNTWAPMPAAPPGFAARWRPNMVWSGKEVIIWGGQGSGSTYLNTGARYDPVTKVWTVFATPPTPIDGRYDGAGFWTGAEFIMWGGYGSYLSSAYGRDDGARYLPGGGWNLIPATGSPGKRWGTVSFWGKGKLWNWGGWSGTGTIGSGAGAGYDPTLDTWTDMDTTGDVPTSRGHAGVAWTGKEAVVWGGTNSTSYYGTAWYSDGAIYRP